MNDMKNKIHQFFLNGEPLNNKSRILTYVSLILGIIPCIVFQYEFSLFIFILSIPLHLFYICLMIFQTSMDLSFRDRTKQNLISLIGLIFNTVVSFSIIAYLLKGI